MSRLSTIATLGAEGWVGGDSRETAPVHKRSLGDAGENIGNISIFLAFSWFLFAEYAKDYRIRLEESGYHE
jgi:hypothetical protein